MRLNGLKMNKYEIRFVDEPHIDRKWIVDAVDEEGADEEALQKMRELCQEMSLPFHRSYIGELIAERAGFTIRELSMAEQMTMVDAPMLPFLEGVV